MKLIGMMLARNEEWVIGMSARAALMWCDELIVLDHASTDRTAAIVRGIEREYPGRVGLTYCHESNWDEMANRQAALEMARYQGATHLAIIDADEILTGNLHPLIPFPTTPARNAWNTGIREIVEKMPTGAILQLPGYNLRGSVGRYHASGIWGHRWFSSVFADDPALGWAGDTFHHREPMGATLTWHRPVQQHRGGVMHLWGASEQRLRAKHALYKMVERVRWPAKLISEIDTLYNLAINPQVSWSFLPVPEAWWAPYLQWAKYLAVDARPWQIDECKRLLGEFGADYFKGLDLFGVAS